MMNLLFVPDDRVEYANYGPGSVLALNSVPGIGVELLPMTAFQILERGDVNAAMQDAKSLVRFFADYDGIVMHSRYLYWVRALRNIGISTAIHVIPDYNYFDVRSIFGLYSASMAREVNDTFFCGSRASSVGFSKGGFSVEPFYPLGIDFGAFAQHRARSKESIRAKLGYSDDSMLFIFSGRMERDKKILEFISAASRNAARWSRKTHFILACRNLNQEYLSEMERVLDRQAAISTLIGMDRSSLSLHIRAADYLFVPGLSEHETFCRAIFEGMAAGTPCIVPDAGPFVEYVGLEQGVRFAVDDSGFIDATSDFWSQIMDADCSPRIDPEALTEYAERFDTRHTVKLFAEAICGAPRTGSTERSSIIDLIFEHYNGCINSMNRAFMESRIGYDELQLTIWRRQLWSSLLRPSLPTH